MATKTGAETYVWYIDESTGGGAYGAPADDQTWSPLDEVVSISGRGKSRERANLRRHGSRERVGSPQLRIDHDDLSFEINLTENAFDNFMAGFGTTKPSVSYAFAVSSTATPAGDHTGTGQTVEYYLGCYLDQIDIAVDNEGIIMGTLTFKVQTSDQITLAGANSDSYSSIGNTYTAHSTASDLKYYIFTDVTIARSSEAHTNYGNFAGSANDSIFHEFGISISQSADKKYRLDGNAYPVGFTFGQYDVTGSLIIDYDNILEFTDLDAKGQLVVTIAGLGTITISGLTYDSAYMDSSPNELITIDLPWTADTAALAVL